jgi:hypothetical protein
MSLSYQRAAEVSNSCFVSEVSSGCLLREGTEWLIALRRYRDDTTDSSRTVTYELLVDIERIFLNWNWAARAGAKRPGLWSPRNVWSF